ncbi:hypothetical protein JNUCC1_00190 [Lentibacillus sp. JNUCC-1]|uniref:Hsp20/alpha crystallin family protein n=1 Tax=Lentibacillus sp. JNUCC-1 TaxID=2654513 RepID=UPI0012E90FDF|nr:Hsp20/alpha crystallin family protein [Lentibacillus sp. JNUCC-1]MUV36388.1 hypothetical protein [Lentibacillus sp. JNUCC-1]
MYRPISAIYGGQPEYTSESHITPLNNQNVHLDVFETDHDVIVEGFVPGETRKEFIAYSVNHKTLQVSLPAEQYTQSTPNGNSQMINVRVRLPSLINEDSSQLYYEDGRIKFKLPKRYPKYKLYLVALLNIFK